MSDDYGDVIGLLNDAIRRLAGCQYEQWPGGDVDAALDAIGEARELLATEVKTDGRGESR